MRGGAWVLGLALLAGCSGSGDDGPGAASQALRSQVELSPAADAYVRSGSYANTRYGAATTLRVDRDDASTNEVSYLRFDVGALDGTIGRAMLRLWARDGSSNSLEVWTVSSTGWSEATVTWNTRPAVDGNLLATLGAVPSLSWIEVDVTSAVAAGLPLSLALVPRSGDGLVIYAKDASSNRPALRIELAGADAGTPEPDAGTPTTDAGTPDAGVNRPPTATAFPVSTAEDSPVAITLTGSDPDGDPLGFSVVTQPAHGSLSGSAPALVYAPAADFAGSDSFSFVASDGRLTSAPATVAITVTPVNDPPVARPDSASTVAGGSVSIPVLANDSDVDGDPLTLLSVGAPAHGSAVVSGANVSYTASAGYQGSDGFSYSVGDGRGAVATATVTVQVSAPAEGHPRLLFGASEIPQLRSRLAGPLLPLRKALAAGVDAAYAGQLPTWANVNAPGFSPIDVADSAGVFAFDAVAFADDPAYAARARQLAINYLVGSRTNSSQIGLCDLTDWVFASWQGYSTPNAALGHVLIEVSLAYDLLYDQLTAAEREQCRRRVAIEGQKLYEATVGAWWSYDLTQNHQWLCHASLGVAALVFRGELSADTDTWLQAAREGLDRSRQALELIQDGPWHEGLGYFGYGGYFLITFGQANARLAGGTDYSDLPLLRDWARVRAFGAPGALAHRREHPVYSDFSGFTNDGLTLTLSYFAARKWRDGLARWYADRYLAGQLNGSGAITSWPPGQPGLIGATVYYDESIAPAAPVEGGPWTLDYFGSDLSLFLSRSGWQEPSALLGLKAGVYMGRATFERVKGGGALPDEELNFGHDHADDLGLYFFADGEWLTTKVPGYYEKAGDPEANRARYANSLLVDGAGQLGEGQRIALASVQPWFFSRESSVPHVGSTAHHSFVMASGAKLYDPALGLTRFDRSVLFLDRRIPVVRDQVRAVGARRFDQVWHALDGVSRDGAWLRLASKNDRVLGVRVVSPASFSLSTETQTAKYLNRFEKDGAMTAALVRPSTNVAAVDFLSVLAPARGSSWSGRPSVSAIDPAVPERGVRVSGVPGSSAVWDVVFTDEPTQTRTASGITVTGLAGVRKSVAGRAVGALLAAGTKLVIDGTVWIEVSGPPATVEAETAGSTLLVSGVGEGPGELRLYAPGIEQVLVNGTPREFERRGQAAVVVALEEAQSGATAGCGGAGLGVLLSPVLLGMGLLALRWKRGRRGS